MKRQYQIEYYPYQNIDDQIIELDLCCLIIEIASLIFVLINKMFVTDLIGAISLVTLPILIFIIYKLIKARLKKLKITIDYLNNQLVITKLFKTKTYNLQTIKIKKELVNENKPHLKPLLMLIFYDQNKIIYKINVAHFEDLTNHQSDNILQ